MSVLGSELITEVWDRPSYKTKEEFLNEVEILKSKASSPEQTMKKEDLIRILDDALKNVRVSPSLVFEEADTDRDGVV